MIKYNKIKSVKLTETQDNTLKKIAKSKVNISNFIRNAIQEKISRDYKELILNPIKNNCPF